MNPAAETDHAPQLADTDLAVAQGAAPEAELVEEELLVEEISIDGMCGVY